MITGRLYRQNHPSTETMMCIASLTFEFDVIHVCWQKVERYALFGKHHDNICKQMNAKDKSVLLETFLYKFSILRQPAFSRESFSSKCFTKIQTKHSLRQSNCKELLEDSLSEKVKEGKTWLDHPSVFSCSLLFTPLFRGIEFYWAGKQLRWANKEAVWRIFSTRRVAMGGSSISCPTQVHPGLTGKAGILSQNLN